MQKPFHRAALFIAALFLSVAPSFGWIDTGHKIIAMIAWEDLTPKARAAVTEMLKHHPRYEKDLLTDVDRDATADEIARHAFAVASTWPDMVRGQSHPMHAAYSHPQWHYVDIPFADDGQSPLDSTHADRGPRNAVEALTQCTGELKEAQTSDEKRAVDLCWVLHLVGDIHQPLHAATHYSKQFPRGDAGGNSDIVLRDPPYYDSKANLHLIWDELPGDYKSEFIDGYLAAGLRADSHFSREKLQPLLNVTDFMAWAKESHQLAVEVAYLNGHLEVATGTHRSTSPGEPIPGLPPGYMEKAERTAMHQITLAGYRLADLLNRLMN